MALASSSIETRLVDARDIRIVPDHIVPSGSGLRNSYSSLGRAATKRKMICRTPSSGENRLQLASAKGNNPRAPGHERRNPEASRYHFDGSANPILYANTSRSHCFCDCHSVHFVPDALVYLQDLDVRASGQRALISRLAQGERRRVVDQLFGGHAAGVSIYKSGGASFLSGCRGVAGDCELSVFCGGCVVGGFCGNAALRVECKFPPDRGSI